MYSYHRSIHHLVKLHHDAEKYYGRCAFITTEPDLKELFNQLATQRRELASHLLNKTSFDKKGVIPAGQTQWQHAASHFQNIWHGVKIALILNDRSKLLRYCAKVEANAWREYQRVLHAADLTDDLFRLMTTHQQNIRQTLEGVKGMPVVKYYMQKKLAA